jgi:hypothetical protein
LGSVDVKGMGWGMKLLGIGLVRCGEIGVAGVATEPLGDNNTAAVTSGVSDKVRIRGERPGKVKRSLEALLSQHLGKMPVAYIVGIRI